MLFFPIEAAIAMTGVVHFLNNLFKISLTGKHLNKEIVLLFGLPAVFAAFLGARLLMNLGEVNLKYEYVFMNKQFMITPLKFIMGIVILFFALFEVLPRFKNMQFAKNKLVFGGFLSGFFGGLSGNQGALRSAFLLRYNLSKESFIATGIAIACLIDITRLGVYMQKMEKVDWRANSNLLLACVLMAFLGAFIGNKLLKKVTLDFVQTIVTIMVIAIALLLMAGIL